MYNISAESQFFFTQSLMEWHKEINKRSMPWKGEKDAYKIWLSEIILQQTRVEQGWNYYERFITNYPTVFHLANAPQNEVFKLWEGLGYYNRCKNLLYTAQYIVKTYNGIFPKSYEALLDLKGVGPYTAAAIASFAYNLPYAVVDGNVFRVLSRFGGIEVPIDSNSGKQLYQGLANKVLDKQQAGEYNQAIMDFGATVCKPFNPLCNTCSLNSQCVAFQHAKVGILPLKEKTIQKRRRYLSYAILQFQDTILVNERKQNDIWQNLFEFYSIDCEEAIVWTYETAATFFQNQLGLHPETFQITSISSVYQQQLTHQHIKGQFITVKITQMTKALQQFIWLNAEACKSLAFPKFINQYLENHPL